MGYQFLAEAKDLWEIEVNRPHTLTTLQAGLIMNTIFSVCSMDDLSSAYLVQIIAMARNLGILESTAHINDEKLRHSYEFTAWALFYWQWYETPSLFTWHIATAC